MRRRLAHLPPKETTNEMNEIAADAVVRCTTRPKSFQCSIRFCQARLYVAMVSYVYAEQTDIYPIVWLDNSVCSVCTHHHSGFGVLTLWIWSGWFSLLFQLCVVRCTAAAAGGGSCEWKTWKHRYRHAKAQAKYVWTIRWFVAAIEPTVWQQYLVTVRVRRHPYILIPSSPCSLYQCKPTYIPDTDSMYHMVVLA